MDSCHSDNSPMLRQRRGRDSEMLHGGSDRSAGRTPVDQFPKINNLRSMALRYAVDSVAPAPVDQAAENVADVLKIAQIYEDYLRGK